MRGGYAFVAYSSGMTRIKKSTKRLIAEIIGWYGTAAILIAYALNSFQIIGTDNLSYQLLNLTGAIGIMVIAAVKGVRQSVVLNIVWGLVALIAIINLLR